MKQRLEELLDEETFEQDIPGQRHGPFLYYLAQSVGKDLYSRLDAFGKTVGPAVERTLWKYVLEPLGGCLSFSLKERIQDSVGEKFHAARATKKSYWLKGAMYAGAGAALLGIVGSVPVYAAAVMEGFSTFEAAIAGMVSGVTSAFMGAVFGGCAGAMEMLGRWMYSNERYYRNSRGIPTWECDNLAGDLPGELVTIAYEMGEGAMRALGEAGAEIRHRAESGK